jgi:murein DD-endopeptidase MepM/ murein hydrolase activator NlpD
MSKDYLDWTITTGPGAGLDMLGRSLRKDLVDFDAFEGKNTFTAIALTDAYPLNEGEAGAFLATDYNVSTGSANAPLSYSRYILKARITGENSPHSFIPDPCDPAFAECPERAIPYVLMHTSFITDSESNMGDMEYITKGTEILVELSRNTYSYNLQFGRIIKVVNSQVVTNAQNQVVARDRCDSLQNMFANEPAKQQPLGDSPTTPGTDTEGHPADTHDVPFDSATPRFHAVIPADEPSQWPTTGTITSVYKLHRLDPVKGKATKVHPGVDVGAPIGTNVYPAIGSGEVVAINQPSLDGRPCRNGAGNCNPSGGGRGFGNWVRIKHIINGRTLHTQYNHLQIVSVNIGDRVGMNTKIAETGHTGYGTGPHLHFELWDGAWTPRRANPTRPGRTHVDPIQGLRLGQHLSANQAPKHQSVRPTSTA